MFDNKLKLFGIRNALTDLSEEPDNSNGPCDEFSNSSDLTGALFGKGY